jgi:uncharacterized protein YecT (DUF1311 family)
MAQEENFIIELLSVERIEAPKVSLPSEQDSDRQKVLMQHPTEKREEIPQREEISKLEEISERKENSEYADGSSLGMQTYSGRVVQLPESGMWLWYILDENTQQFIFLATTLEKNEMLETCMGGIIVGGLEFLATHRSNAVSRYSIELTGEAHKSDDGSIALSLEGSHCRRKTEQPAPLSPPASSQADARPQAARTPTAPAGELHSPEPSSPSFDCAKAQTPVELAICSDASLAQLDVAMARAYALVSERLADKKPLLAEQKAWFRARNGCASSADPAQCIRQSYTTRIQQLERYSSSSASPVQ